VRRIETDGGAGREGERASQRERKSERKRECERERERVCLCKKKSSARAIQRKTGEIEKVKVCERKSKCVRGGERAGGERASARKHTLRESERKRERVRKSG